jgi:hypothetical protein
MVAWISDPELVQLQHHLRGCVRYEALGAAPGVVATLGHFRVMPTNLESGHRSRITTLRPSVGEACPRNSPGAADTAAVKREGLRVGARLVALASTSARQPADGVWRVRGRGRRFRRPRAPCDQREASALRTGRGAATDNVDSGELRRGEHADFRRDARRKGSVAECDHDRRKRPARSDDDQHLPQAEVVSRVEGSVGVDECQLTTSRYGRWKAVPDRPSCPVNAADHSIRSSFSR